MVLIALVSIVGLGIILLTAWQMSQQRKINFILAVVVMLVTTPLLGYFILDSLPSRNPKGCKWCGNKDHEATYCGVCNKNDKGELRPVR